MHRPENRRSEKLRTFTVAKFDPVEVRRESQLECPCRERSGCHDARVERFHNGNEYLVSTGSLGQRQVSQCARAVGALLPS